MERLEPIEKEALEAAFYEWWGENDHALALSAPGNVFDLLLRLNAALAKSRNSVAGTSSAPRNSFPSRMS
jgi:hypothetical protein